jgi:hypothetical protein
MIAFFKNTTTLWFIQLDRNKTHSHLLQIQRTLVRERRDHVHRRPLRAERDARLLDLESILRNRFGRNLKMKPNFGQI